MQFFKLVGWVKGLSTERTHYAVLGDKGGKATTEMCSARAQGMILRLVIVQWKSSWEE